MNQLRNRFPAGFSLLELLVVISIIGILAAAAIPRFGDFRASAYDSRSQQDLRNLAAAQELFRAVHEEYASDLQNLTAFVASDGVTVSIDSANEGNFTASASHPSGRLSYAWDSSADPAMSSEAQ